MKLTIQPPRRDGKYPVTLSYAGAPNMFGGHYPDTVFRKLYPLEKVKEGDGARHTRAEGAIRSAPTAT